MEKQRLLIVFILVILAFTATGCGSKSGPEGVYWQYWDACSEGRFTEAEQFISDIARETAMTLGSCALTHDAINTIEAANGNPPRTFSEDPEVNTLSTSFHYSLDTQMVNVYNSSCS